MNSKRFKPLVVLTGAGISAESGIRTFRDANGLWENHRIEDVASPEGFERDPRLVHDFYNLRRAQLKDPSVQPNVAHVALARLEREWEGDFLLVTQNVDDLHDRAGSRRLVHMHGELLKVKCASCDRSSRWEKDLSTETSCPSCGKAGELRPDIVWFGEMPYSMELIQEAVESCGFFISIGTSGRVYPAAGLARLAWKAHRIELNLDESDVSTAFHEHRRGPATLLVPQLVDELLT